MYAYISHLSLIHGWPPVVVQAITAVVLVCAIGWRSPRWRALWLPVMVASGVVLAVWAHWYLGSLAVAGDPAPPLLWVWIAAAGFAAGVVMLARAARGGGGAARRWWQCRCACSAFCSRSTCGLAISPPCTRPGISSPPAHCRTRPIGPGDQAAADGCAAGQRGCPAGEHPGRCVEVRPPPRTGVPAAGLLRQQPPSPAADRDDDRRRHRLHPLRRTHLLAAWRRGDLGVIRKAVLGTRRRLAAARPAPTRSRRQPNLACAARGSGADATSDACARLWPWLRPGLTAE